MDNKDFYEGFNNFLANWDQVKSKELKEEGIIKKDDNLYKNDELIFIIDDRDPLLEYLATLD